MKKVTYKIMQVLLVALLMLTTFTFNRQNDVEAISKEGIQSSVEISGNKKDEYFSGDVIRFKGKWSIPNDQPGSEFGKGDSFVVKIPKELNVAMPQIPLYSSDTVGLDDGTLLGMGVYDEASHSIVFEFTEAIEQIADRHGGFNLKFTVKNLGNEEKEDIDLDFKDENNTTIGRETITVGKGEGEVVGDSEEKFHKAAYPGQTVDGLEWYIRVNQSRDLKDSEVTLRDNILENHELVAGSVRIYRSTDSGTGTEVKELNDSVLYDKDLKGFEVVLPLEQENVWYTVFYSTKYTGGFLEQDVVDLFNEVYLTGDKSGSVPLDNGEEANLAFGEFDLGGWGKGNNQYGKVRLKKVDAITGKALANVGLELRHTVYSDQVLSGVTDENGILETEATIIDGLYELKETSTPEGYEPIIADKVYVSFDENNEFIYVVENEPKKISIEGEKTWLDEKGQEIASQEAIILQLYANDELIRQIVLNKGESHFEFKNLRPLDKKGEEINYEVKEIPIKGYQSSIEENTEDGKVLVTNQKETVNIQGRKVWTNAKGEEIESQGEITIYLLANGKKVSETILAKGETEFSFESLPKYDEKNKVIDYSIQEKAFEGFTISITEDKDGHFVVKNQEQQEYIDIEGMKQWFNHKGESIPSAAAVSIELYANDQKINSYVLKENNYTFSFTNLAKTDENGEEIKYSIKEVPLEGYKSEISQDEDGLYIVTNTEEKPVIEYTSIKGHKEWLNAQGEEIEAASDITIELLANGERKDTFVLSKGEKSFEFSNLPVKDEEGKAIQYSIRELKLEGFESEISHEGNTYLIQNIKEEEKEPEMTSVQVRKVWHDHEGLVIPSESDIKIELYANGQFLEAKTLEKGKHLISFDNLAKYDEDDQEIKYEVQEVELDGFVPKIERENANDFVITNTKEKPTIEYTSLKGKKAWFDASGEAIESQANIEILLYANGHFEDKLTLEKGQDNFVFENLAKTDEKGRKIIYTIKEAHLEGYESDVIKQKDGSFLIKNTQNPKPEKPVINLKGEKRWVDAEGKSIPSQAEISIELYANGEKIKTIILEKGHKRFSFENLPKFDEKGQIIDYTIEEKEIAGYDATITKFEDGSYLITNKSKEEPVKPKPAEPVKPKPAEPVKPKPAEPAKPKPKEPEVEEVDSVSIEPKEPEKQDEPEEVEEVLEAYVLPQTGQGVSGIVYTGLAGFILGLFLYLKDRKDQ